MASSTPSQQFVPIKEIRDGVAVLKDGGLRAVLLATAVNLGLKSAEEQHATLSQFQSFLNSIEFPIQVVTSSRRLDIRPYLITLEKRLPEIPEELLRLQTREYIQFIRDFNERYNIMSKFFYVVVPFSGSIASAKNSGFNIGGILGKKEGKTKAAQLSATFEENRSQLEQRVAIVKQGLSSMGVESKQMNTEQLIDLYRNYMNPGELHQSAGTETTQFELEMQAAREQGIISTDELTRYTKEKDAKKQKEILEHVMGTILSRRM